MSIVFIQGDTAPDLTATIHKADDATIPADLTAATVSFRMRKPDDRRYTVNQPAAIVDAPTGRVSYTWSANDLAVPGTYEVTWHITFPDGKEQTTLKQTIEVQRE